VGTDRKINQKSIEVEEPKDSRRIHRQRGEVEGNFPKRHRNVEKMKASVRKDPATLTPGKILQTGKGEGPKSKASTKWRERMGGNSNL